MDGEVEMKNLKIVRNKKQLICMFSLYYVLFIGFFTWNFGLSESAYYILDILILLLFPLCIGRIKKGILNKDVKLFTILILGLLIVGTLSAIVQSFHLSLWIWSIRNWGRMIVFFYLAVASLRLKIVDRTINFFIRLYDINTIVILMQFLFFNERYGTDQLNGFFGRVTNGINVTVSLLVFCIVLSGYFAKTISIKRVLLTVIEISIVAALAELRAIFVFLVVIVFVYTIINIKLSANQLFKYLIIAVAVISIMMISSNYLVRLYPQFEGFFNIRRIIADATIEGGYGYTGYIDRLNAIPVINKYFFDGMGVWNKLFGIGMGNGEYSTLKFLTSSFYNQYGGTFRYLNFTSAMLYLEVGLVGLALYTISFISLFLKFAKKIKHTTNNQKIFYENIGMGAALISIIFILYNNLQRTDAGIIIAFFLAIPIIARKEMKYGQYN